MYPQAWASQPSFEKNGSPRIPNAYHPGTPRVRRMLKKAFVYVENLTWVQQRPNNTIANSVAEHVCRSHRTMLMFRRDVRQFPEAKEVELRHQRNADCTLNTTCTTKSGRRKIPEHVYKAMETLLPEAYAAGSKGRLLELWAEPGSDARRSGWTAVADGPATPKTSGTKKTSK